MNTRQEITLGQDFLEERLQLSSAQEQGTKEKHTVYTHIHRRRVEGEGEYEKVEVQPTKAERRAQKRVCEKAESLEMS